VIHVPKVLYHKRDMPSLVATGEATKSEAPTTAKQALADFVREKASGSKIVNRVFRGS
jgi:hypothetical protein